jgi:hypothetical protein
VERLNEEVAVMLRSVTGALSLLGLAVALLGVGLVFVSAPVGLAVGICGFVLSGGSVVQRDGTESMRNVAALGALVSTATICASFILL